MNVFKICMQTAVICGGAQLLQMRIELLHQLKRIVRADGLAPRGIFAGGQVGLKIGIGLWEAAANGLGKLNRTHGFAALPA